VGTTTVSSDVQSPFARILLKERLVFLEKHFSKGMTSLFRLTPKSIRCTFDGRVCGQKKVSPYPLSQQIIPKGSTSHGRRIQPP
jgi:hypothetical protein